MSSIKLLRIVFVILVLITIGELSYYILFVKSNVINNLSNRSAGKDSYSMDPENLDKLDKKPENLRQAVHPEFIEYLKGVLTGENSNNNKILFTIENKGEVVEIDPDGKNGPNAVTFPYGIKFKPAENSESAWNYFSKELLSKTRVYIIMNGIETPGTLSDLKAGEKIIMQDISDMIYSPDDPEHIYANVIKIVR